MPKRTYPDQDGLHLRGAGDGFTNMRQLYTILGDWEAWMHLLFMSFLFSLNHTGVLVFTLLQCWFLRS